MAIDTRLGKHAEPGTIIHSDHGVQFGSWAFTKRARDSGLLASMGSIGNCYDCEQNQVLPGRGLTRAYDWPWCLGVDLSAPARW